jgi:hypothetical protein
MNISLRTKYKKHRARFTQTGAGINPLDATGAKNLRGKFFYSNLLNYATRNYRTGLNRLPLV